jgi:hypothetical protein
MAARRSRLFLPVAAVLVGVAALLGGGGCDGGSSGSGTVPSSLRAAARPSAPRTPVSAVPTGPRSPAGGTPSFTVTISRVTAADVPHTWHSGCPVGPADLRLMHLSFWGFDGRTHVGTLVVNASVTSDVTRIFGTLYREQFPIRRMQPQDAFNGSDPDSTAADNTAGFNCRAAVATATAHWSARASGEAIEINPVENPYVQGSAVQPPAGRGFLDRSRVRPGMAVENGDLVKAFAAAGWSWGGRQTSAPDYQHFSKTGG